LDVSAIPAVGLLVRRAQRGFDETRVPLLGVMGAFIFAAQMINFPVGAGTSGHLVGGALLAYTLGPAAAGVVMTAILAIQALVFQDGGLLALGANVMNMAVAGVLAGYLPYWIFGLRWRDFSIFAGGMLSVLVSALLALGQLAVSGVPMPGAVLGVSLGLFVIAAAMEGLITLAVVRALESIQPGFIRKPAAGRSYAVMAAGIAAVLIAGVGVLVASTHPDGLEKVLEQTGIVSEVSSFIQTPLADYEAMFVSRPWVRKASAGLAGLALVYGACLVVGRVVTRNRSA
jgi:cobalt/nickel transport system permease protein